MSITASNAVVMLSILGLYNTPQQLQGFSADDVYNIAQIRSVETVMGVDGILSGGFVFSSVVQGITLQADSASNTLFDAWWLQMQASGDVFTAEGLIRLNSVATKFTQVKGFLTAYTPIASAKRILQPRTHEITWERVFPSPA